MKNRRKSYANIFFLLVFLFVTLGINFTHTERFLTSSDSCPACHFQNSTFTTNQIDFFHLPQLALIDYLDWSEPYQIHETVLVAPSSRSPPTD